MARARSRSSRGEGGSSSCPGSPFACRSMRERRARPDVEALERASQWSAPPSARSSCERPMPDVVDCDSQRCPCCACCRERSIDDAELSKDCGRKSCSGAPTASCGSSISSRAARLWFMNVRACTRAPRQAHSPARVRRQTASSGHMYSRQTQARKCAGRAGARPRHRRRHIAQRRLCGIHCFDVAFKTLRRGSPTEHARSRAPQLAGRRRPVFSARCVDRRPPAAPALSVGRASLAERLASLAITFSSA